MQTAAGFTKVYAILQSQAFNAHFPPYGQAGALVEASLSQPLSAAQETFGMLPTTAMDLALQLLDFFLCCCCLMESKLYW